MFTGIDVSGGWVGLNSYMLTLGHELLDHIHENYGKFVVKTVYTNDKGKKKDKVYDLLLSRWNAGFVVNLIDSEKYRILGSVYVGRDEHLKLEVDHNGEITMSAGLLSSL